jgi:MFS family permease
MTGTAKDPKSGSTVSNHVGTSPAAQSGAPPVTRYQRQAIVASAVGYAMDGFDTLVLSFSLAAIAATFGASKSEAGMLTTLTLWGAVLGGIMFGILADRIGRVSMLSLSILLFAVATGVCALSPSLGFMYVFRFVAGLGLGGEFGIGMALAAEAWPAARRARATALVGLGWQSGVLVAALLSPVILRAWDWRGLFALGTVPAIAAFFVRRHTREPDLFLEAKAERSREATGRLGMRAQAAQLLADRRTAFATIGILVLCCGQNFGYYGIMTWLPSYLSDKFGYGLTKSGLWTAVTVIGMAIGIGLFGVLADRFGRRRIFWFYQIGAIVTLIVYSTLSGSITLLVGGAIMGFFVNGMLGGIGALIAEHYPTDVRATAENLLFNIGRGVGGLGPLYVPVVAAHRGFSFAIASLAVIYVIEFGAMFLISDRKGVELDTTPTSDALSVGATGTPLPVK